MISGQSRLADIHHMSEADQPFLVWLTPGGRGARPILDVVYAIDSRAAKVRAEELNVGLRCFSVQLRLDTIERED